MFHHWSSAKEHQQAILTFQKQQNIPLSPLEGVIVPLQFSVHEYSDSSYHMCLACTENLAYDMTELIRLCKRCSPCPIELLSYF